MNKPKLPHLDALPKGIEAKLRKLAQVTRKEEDCSHGMSVSIIYDDIPYEIYVFKSGWILMEAGDWKRDITQGKIVFDGIL